MSNKSKSNTAKELRLPQDQLDYLAKRIVELQEERKKNEPLKDNVRRILFSLPMLKKHLKNKEKFIDKLKENNSKERSKDIVMMPVSGGIKRSKEEVLDDVLNEREIAFEETKIYIEWIDSCLTDVRTKIAEKNKNDNYYRILEMKYFDGLTLEEVASELPAAVSTVKYQHRLLLNHCAVAIFGEKGIDS